MDFGENNHGATTKVVLLTCSQGCWYCNAILPSNYVEVFKCGNLKFDLQNLQHSVTEYYIIVM